CSFARNPQSLSGPPAHGNSTDQTTAGATGSEKSPPTPSLRSNGDLLLLADPPGRFPQSSTAARRSRIPGYTLPGYCTMILYRFPCQEPPPMAHTIRDKKKLLNRVRRIRGQIDAVEKALDQEQDCSTILLTIAACRGAINSLMAEIIEGHIRFH